MAPLHSAAERRGLRCAKLAHLTTYSTRRRQPSDRQAQSVTMLRAATAVLACTAVQSWLVPSAALRPHVGATRLHGTKRTAGGGGAAQAKSGGGFGAADASAKPSVAPSTTSPTADADAALAAFVTAAGGDLSGVEVASFSGQRGVRAAKAFAKGDVVMKIPTQLALLLSMEETTMEEALDPAVISARNACTLAEKYLADANIQREWKPYLDSLPLPADDRSPTADLFDEAALKATQWPPLGPWVLKRRAAVSAAAKEAGIPESDVQRGLWLASTRGFNVALPQRGPNGEELGKSLWVMIPFMDLCNHDEGGSGARTLQARAVTGGHVLAIDDVSSDDANFIIRAGRPIAKGAQVQFVYGDGLFGSAEMLAEKGFVPAHSGGSATEARDAMAVVRELGRWEASMRADPNGPAHPLLDTTLAEDEALLVQALLGGDAAQELALRLRVNLKRSMRTDVFAKALKKASDKATAEAAAEAMGPGEAL